MSINIRTDPLEFITRDGCHLCDEAAATVRRVAALSGRTLLITDIDGRPDLVRFTHRVPVVRVGGSVIAEETVRFLPTWLAALGR